MFSYAQAETILARLHGATEQVQKGAFRARLKHLKRLGIPLGSTPGRGKKVDYDIEHICQWAFCLELEQMGLDPTLIVDIVKYNWSIVYVNGFRCGSYISETKVFFYCEPSIMTAAWGGKTGGAFDQLGQIGLGSIEDVVKIIEADLKSGRLALIDLSRILDFIYVEGVAITQNWQ